MPSSSSSSTLFRAVLPSQLPFEPSSLPEPRRPSSRSPPPVSPSSPRRRSPARRSSLLLLSSGSPRRFSTSPVLDLSSSSSLGELSHRSPSPSPSTSSSAASSTSSSSSDADDSLFDASFSSSSSVISSVSSASSFCDSPSPSTPSTALPRIIRARVDPLCAQFTMLAPSSSTPSRKTMLARVVLSGRRAWRC
ncbi:hypothetical protein JCM8547_001218 [Rhodosporidiobolus lusitaniae]